MDESEIHVPDEENKAADVVLAICVLRKLPEYTQELEVNYTDASYRIVCSAIGTARWYYRRYSKYGGFVRLLNTYLAALNTDLRDVASEKADIIARECEVLKIPQFRRGTPCRLVALLMLSVVCGIVVIILVAAELGSGGASHPTNESCGDSSRSQSTRNEGADIASVVLSAVSVVCCVMLFPLIHMYVNWKSNSEHETLIDRILQMAKKGNEKQEFYENPLSEVTDTSDRNAIERNEGFLMNADSARRHRKAIAMLLTEATEDEGNVMLRSRGLPPVNVSLNAFYRHTIIIMTNLDGQVVMWSDGAATCLGFSARDAEGNNINTLLYGEKSIEQYNTMTEAAAKNVDLSEKTLTLAHMSLGSISISATVVVSRNTESGQLVGYTLIGSVRSDELSQTQALFHSFFITELSQLSIKDSQFRQIIDCLRWKNLRDFSALARDWNSAHIRRLLADVIKGRQRLVDVEVDPKVTELPPILCDVTGVTAVLNRTCDLFSEKIRIRVEQKRTTSAIYQLVVIFQYDAAEINRETLASITRSVNDLGGMLIDFPGTLKLLLPFMVRDEGIQALRRQGPAVERSTGHDPLVVLLLEKNAVHRHNISAAIWNYGHSLRRVENVRKALQAIEDSTDLGCAIVDVDVKGSDRVIEALLSKHIHTIETSEGLDGVAKGGDALLKKPLSNEELKKELDRATEKVEEAKRAGELVMKQREVFGKVRNSPWKQGRLLGRGGFATVYEATSTLTGGKMAAKMIRVGGSFEEHIEEFMNEIEILSKLTHPNIIHYFYCERTETTLNLFMELADEGTVADLLLRCPRLPENHVVTITKQLLQAVNYLHECGIVHRDIKPGNMLISQGQLKLSDFGTATSNINMSEGTVGTMSYMAPEVVDGKASGKESDIWSIGCVVCECLQVKRPGGGLLGYGAPKEFPSDLSADAVDFIKACMHINPAERATAGTLLLHDFIVHLDHEVLHLAEALPEANPVEEKKRATDGSALSTSDEISWSFD